jgi:replicative DNA helicase
MTDNIPQTIESEQGVLACIFLSPNDCLGECVAQWGESAEPFYDLRHRAVYSKMLELYGKGSPIDVVTVVQGLVDDKSEVDSGYVSGLPDFTPSAANLKYYMESVRDKWLLRRLLFTCQGLERRIAGGEVAVEALLDDAEKEVLGVQTARDGDKMDDSRTLVGKTLDTIEACFERGGAISGLPTGYIDLDRKTAGLHKGEMFVLAARPSMGKTSLAMNIAENVAVDQGKQVGVFSLEMTSESLMQRMMCSRARLDLSRVRDGKLHEADFPKLSTVGAALAGAGIHIDDSSSLTILQLRARARRMHQRFGLSLLVVDYLQLCRSPGRGKTREREVADISAGLKSLAKEMMIPVLVLSQLNRGVEREKGGTPRLSDLRESGAIEQDADVVALLHREEQDSPDYNGVPMTLLIAKQRNGPTGPVPLTFMRQYTRFESRSGFADE